MRKKPTPILTTESCSTNGEQPEEGEILDTPTFDSRSDSHTSNQSGRDDAAGSTSGNSFELKTNVLAWKLPPPLSKTVAMPHQGATSPILRNRDAAGVQRRGHARLRGGDSGAVGGSGAPQAGAKPGLRVVPTLSALPSLHSGSMWANVKKQGEEKKTAASKQSVQRAVVPGPGPGLDPNRKTVHVRGLPSTYTESDVKAALPAADGIDRIGSRNDGVVIVFKTAAEALCAKRRYDKSLVGADSSEEHAIQVSFTSNLN